MDNRSADQEREAIAQRHEQYTGFRWAALAASCLTLISFQIAAMPCNPLLGKIARSLNVDCHRR
jgi:hypothetical protein